MTKEIKKWWEGTAIDYQKECKIPIDIHYGPGSPNEDYHKLMGKLKGKKILEIGCGGAQCGIAMAKQGAKVIGIDLSKEQLNFAKELAKKHKVKINLIQGSFQNLKKFKSNSYDVVFSAFAFQYSPDLKVLFKQIYRILKKNGLFVFSLDHPFYHTIDPKTLKIKESYFNTGKHEEVYFDKTKKFVMYYRTFSDLYNSLVESKFFVEKIIEPDSRKKYPYDPWYGMWDYYLPKIMNNIPQTIIFKCIKPKNA